MENLKTVLNALRSEGRILLAYLYGSTATGDVHPRSDIDIALYLNVTTEREEIEAIDRILMAADRQIEILRLNDEDESPFVIQQALKGIPLIESDPETYYKVVDRTLHESESIRFHREYKK